MKVLLVFPDSYSLRKIFDVGFRDAGHEVSVIGYRELLNPWKHRINTQMFRLPQNYRNKWDKKYLGNINHSFLNYFSDVSPDFVLIYNDQYLLAETVRIMQLKCKVSVYLGDNPFYIFTRPFFLGLIREVDAVFAPDTFWISQLKILGLNNVYHLIPGYDPSINYPLELTTSQMKANKSEILFIGNSYTTSWGYKRALFLNQFAGFDLKLYGNRTWYRWFRFFPQLQEKFTLLKSPLSFETVNLLSNCTSIYPVDANPGLLHGVHLRIFDCIGSGTLPLIEYRKDLDEVFPGIALPLIHNYNQAGELASHFLKNETERRNLIRQLQEYTGNHFKPVFAAEKIIDAVFKQH